VAEQLLHIFPGSGGSSGCSLAGGSVLPRSSEFARYKRVRVGNKNLEGEGTVCAIVCNDVDQRRWLCSFSRTERVRERDVLDRGD
jgi:hypothetical protein